MIEPHPPRHEDGVERAITIAALALVTLWALEPMVACALGMR